MAVSITTPAALAASENVIKKPMPIKAVVLAMFEHGEVTGDRPGELQLWLERGGLDNKIDFPLGEHDIYTNNEGVLVICTGGGVPNATASVMALGMDQRFDFSDTYWLVAGIGGGDPSDVSLGTGVWAKHVVDGDLLYEIDAREIPKEWEYGLIPLGAYKPNQESTGWTVDTIHFALNEPLVDWAYNLTKDYSVADTPAIKEFREQYVNFPNARKKPFVTMGDTIGSSKYWHGELLNNWANDWMHLYAGPDSEFMTTNMEDNGTFTAFGRLARTGLVDKERVLVLRTVSNYTHPPKDKTAAWSTTAPYPDGGLPAIVAAFEMGTIVIDNLVQNWDIYQDAIPGSAEAAALAKKK
ncbi:purine nucleoside permease [Colwellia echini]|uniref:Purine nucleoside permease n=2 Tax=Colwellia echini TaxID=1982103 RepID=A0ABY3MZN6_9GAMM|nr:purine nucleoside permease [Colwellia echini]